MQINYLDAVSSVLNMMKQPDSACKNIDMHRTCCTTFSKYLMDNDIPFSMDAALDWLEIKKLEISYEACSQYRNALFRLEHYLLLGISKVLSAVRKTAFSAGAECRNPFSVWHMSWKNTMRPAKTPAITIRIPLP